MARLHPYNFVHKLLPQLAWRRPVAVRHELSDPVLARDLLRYVWDKTAEALAPQEQLSPHGLGLSWHEVAGRATALVQLPAPQGIGDVYFVALVYEDDADEDVVEDEDDDDDELLENRPRYFLLEATMGLAHEQEGVPTMIGERRGDVYHHLMRGPGGGRPGTAAAFLQQLADVLGPLPGAGLPYMRIVRS